MSNSKCPICDDVVALLRQARGDKVEAERARDKAMKDLESLEAKMKELLEQNTPETNEDMEELREELRQSKVEAKKIRAQVAVLKQQLETANEEKPEDDEGAFLDRLARPDGKYAEQFNFEKKKKLQTTRTLDNAEKQLKNARGLADKKKEAIIKAIATFVSHAHTVQILEEDIKEKEGEEVKTPTKRKRSSTQESPQTPKRTRQESSQKKPAKKSIPVDSEEDSYQEQNDSVIEED